MDIFFIYDINIMMVLALLQMTFNRINDRSRYVNKTKEVNKSTECEYVTKEKFRKLQQLYPLFSDECYYRKIINKKRLTV